MKPRTTLILAAVLVVLGAVAFLVQGPWRNDRPREKPAVFPGIAAKDLQVIRATRPGGPDGGPLLLTRSGAGWAVGEEKRAADDAAVERLAQDLATLQEAATASTNPKKHGLFEVDATKGIGVRLEGAGGKLLAAFTVGATAPDYSSSYLRREGEDRVLLVPVDLRGVLARPVDAFLKKETPPPPAAAAPAAK